MLDIPSVCTIRQLISLINRTMPFSISASAEIEAYNHYHQSSKASMDCASEGNDPVSVEPL